MNSISKQYKSISSSPISIHRSRDVTEIFRVFVRTRQFSFSEISHLQFVSSLILLARFINENLNNFLDRSFDLPIDHSYLSLTENKSNQ